MKERMIYAHVPGADMVADPREEQEKLQRMIADKEAEQKRREAEIVEDMERRLRGKEPNPNPVDDPIHHPSHYTHGDIECIDAIRAALTEEEFRGFCRGNAIKYLWRMGRKGSAAEDAGKASWYLDRLGEE